jgi:hypothetical protein
MRTNCLANANQDHFPCLTTGHNLSSG